MLWLSPFHVCPIPISVMMMVMCMPVFMSFVVEIPDQHLLGDVRAIVVNRFSAVINSHTHWPICCVNRYHSHAINHRGLC